MTTKEKATTHHRTAHAAAVTAAEVEPPANAAPAAASTVASTATSTAPTTLTPEVAQQMLSQINWIATVLATLAPPLTIEGRRQQPKMKIGGGKHMPTVFDVADQYGVAIPGSTTASARADLDLVNTLQPVIARLASVTTLGEDVLLQANGRSWDTTTTLYSMLVRLVKRFPALQGELQPMASFMARLHKDAPSSLRKAEAGSLAKGRATRKANAGSKAKGTVDPTTPAPAAASNEEASTPAAAAGTTPVPVAPVVTAPAITTPAAAPAVRAN